MSLSGMMFAAAIAVSAPIAPPTNADLISTTVSFGDLDLSTSAGQERLHARLTTQIRRMCAVESPLDLRMAQLRSACIASASRNAEVAVARAVAAATRQSELAAR